MGDKFINRLEDFAHDNKLNLSNLGDLIGSSRQNMSRYKNGSLPKLDFFQQLVLRFQNIDLNWLISGKGSMYLRPKGEEYNVEKNTVNESQAHYNSKKTEQMNEQTLKWMQDKIDELLQENRELKNELLGIAQNQRKSKGA